MSNPSRRSWYRLSSIVRPTPHSSRDPSPPRHVIEPSPSLAAPPSPPPPPPIGHVIKPSPSLAAPPSPPPPPRHVIEPSPPSLAAPPSPPPPPQPLPTSLRPLPKEVQEAKPTPVTSSRSMKHEPPKQMHEHETTHQKNILTLSEKTNLVHGPNKGQHQQQRETDDVVMGIQGVIITISGENKGAVMEILRSSNKSRGIGKGRRLLSSSEDDEGEESKSKSKKHSNYGENLPMDGFVNSNVQMINSSVVYNSTETHHDLGVHLSLYRKPSSGNGFIIKDHGNGYNSSIN